MLRGINRQTTFEDDEDYVKFIDVIKQSKEKSEFEENEAYLVTALRYIHRNPIKAGIVNSILDKILKNLKVINGVTIRQLVRTTWVSKYMVERT